MYPYNRIYRLALFGSMLILACGDIAATGSGTEQSIPHGYACDRCQLQVRPFAVLGKGLTGANPVIGSKVTRDSRGYYYVAPTTDPEHVLVLNPRGEFAGVVGSKGRGPGEFDHVERLAVLEADSLAVSEVTRVSVFDAGRSFVRTLGVSAPIAGMFALPDTQGLLLVYQDRAQPDYPFHVHIDADRPRFSFGARVPSQYNPITSPRVAAVQGGVLWTARRNDYVLEQFDIETGRRLGGWRRHTNWFVPHSTLEEYAESLTRVQAIQPASDSTVWVAVRKRNPQPTTIEASSFERTASGEIIARRISSSESRDLYDTYVELLDVNGNRGITGASFELFGGFLDSDHVYTYKEDELGVVEIHVWQLINNPNP